MHASWPHACDNDHTHTNTRGQRNDTVHEACAGVCGSGARLPNSAAHTPSDLTPQLSHTTPGAIAKKHISLGWLLKVVSTWEETQKQPLSSGTPLQRAWLPDERARQSPTERQCCGAISAGPDTRCYCTLRCMCVANTQPYKWRQRHAHTNAVLACVTAPNGRRQSRGIARYDPQTVQV